MRVRPQIRDRQLFDVRASDLERDPVATVRSIFQHFGLPWDEESMAHRIKVHLREERERTRALERGRKHVYSPEQYGLSTESLTAEFEDYESVFL